MLISASWCIFCIYMHILSLLAYVSFTFLSGTVWRKLAMLDFVEDLEPDSRFPGIWGRSLIGGLALTAGDRSSTSILVDCRYLRLACRVIDLVPSILLLLKLGQSVLRAHYRLRGLQLWILCVRVLVLLFSCLRAKLLLTRQCRGDSMVAWLWRWPAKLPCKKNDFSWFFMCWHILHIASYSCIY